MESQSLKCCTAATICLVTHVSAFLQSWLYQTYTLHLHTPQSLDSLDHNGEKRFTTLTRVLGSSLSAGPEHTLHTDRTAAKRIVHHTDRVDNVVTNVTF